MPDEALVPANSELVSAFLAASDTPCPGCGYNLRGIGEPTCPECGQAIELTLARPAQGRGYLWLVLLTLCWVAMASSMNGVRWWKTVRSQAATGPWFTLRTSAQLRIAQSLTPSAPVAVRTMIPPSGSLQTTNQGTTLTTTGPTVLTFPPAGSGGVTLNTGALTITPSVTAAGRNWSAVSWATWASFGFWVSLGLLGLAALVVCLVRRRRFFGPVPPRRLVGAALSLFAVYAGYHLVMFAREVIS